MSNANSPTAESVYDDSDEVESVVAAEVAALLLPPRSTSTNSPFVVNTSTSDVAMSSGDAVDVERDSQQPGALDSTIRPIPSSTEIIMNESAIANTDPRASASAVSASSTSFTAPAEASNATASTTEFFKVPFPPPAAAQSLQGLPADIEHIIAMGLDAPDESEPVPTSNYEKVVKDLREKVGFGDSTNEETVAVPSGDGLASIEQEMLVGGVPRQEANVEMSNGEIVNGVEWTATRDATMEESSDASSDSSDSEAEVGSIPLDIPESTSTAPKSKKAQAKANRKKKAASDDDLSDDDVNTSSTAPKTEHEVALPVIEAPKITMIPESEEIIKFGTIASVIDTVVVVKADTAGDWRVLDEGSLCCWEDRGVIGNIFETFGSVQSPFYSVRFPSSSTLDPLVYSIGKAVFYAPKMSSFVFTRDIRALKGSDASNVWDEEVGAAEMEYSDDEQEHAQKRNAKNERKARSASLAPSDASRQGSRTPSVGPSTSKSNSHPSSLPPRPPASARQPYDSDTYVPLERPRDLHLMGNAPPPPREGRQMFERDNGGRLGGGGMGVEYDFSDDDETGSISSTFEVDERYREIDEMARVERENAASRGGARGGRGGAARGGNDDRGGRGRGGFEGRGRGRGNFDDRGRGGGRGRGDGNMRGGGSDRGRGGERNGPSNGPPRRDESPRQVAPLPQRYSGPPGPGFNGPPPLPPQGYSPSRPGPNAPHLNSNPSQSPRPMQYPHYPQQLQPQYSPHQPHSPAFHPPPPPHGQPPPFAFNPMAAMGGFNSYPQQRQPLYQNQSRSFNSAGAPIPSVPTAQQSPPAPQYPPPNQFGFPPNQYMPFAPQMMGFPGFMGQQYSPGGAGGAPGQFQQQQNVWRNQNSSQGPAGQGGASGGAQEGRPTGNTNAYRSAGQNGDSRD